MFLRRGYFPNMRWRLPVGLARIYNAWSVTGLGKYFCGFARKASRSTRTSLVMDIPTRTYTKLLLSYFKSLTNHTASQT